ncbi:hypothetical protein OG218_01005 [Kineococcus sp. NBC_00420]|uniref:hypothetical protein n=1 Tax=Kineococcus sp. NBC_00420 TaxID=2903564 RepID=UPI002E1F8DE9
MSALVGSRVEKAVQRLVPLVASRSLDRDDRLRAARALVTLLQDGDPVAAHLVAGDVERNRAPATEALQTNGAPARKGRVRRGLRAAGDLLDFLNPF